MKSLNCGRSAMSLWLFRNGARPPELAASDLNCDVFTNIKQIGTREIAEPMKHVEYSPEHIVKVRIGEGEGEILEIKSGNSPFIK